jgi:hypothetical protein
MWNEYLGKSSREQSSTKINMTANIRPAGVAEIGIVGTSVASHTTLLPAGGTYANAKSWLQRSSIHDTTLSPQLTTIGSQFRPTLGQ